MIQWANMWVVHLGAWMTFLFAADVYKNGMPELKSVPSKLKTAIVLAALLSIFSSHSHHYLQYISQILKQ